MMGDHTEEFSRELKYHVNEYPRLPTADEQCFIHSGAVATFVSSSQPDASFPFHRTELRHLPARPPCHPLRKTFMPSLVVKKQRAKNLSAC